MSTKSEYCVHIFNSIQKECDKRGEYSKECILLNDIFDKNVRNITVIVII